MRCSAMRTLAGGWLPCAAARAITTSTPACCARSLAAAEATDRSAPGRMAPTTVRQQSRRIIMTANIPRFLGNLGSGGIVIDRPRSSHVQSHKLPDGVLARALAKIDAGKRDRIVQQVDFSEVIGVSTCVETAPKDDIVYARRFNRGGMTRFVRGRQARPCKSVVVILQRWGRIDG